MTQASIVALATGTPGPRYSQAELYHRMVPYFGPDPQVRAIFERSGIECRHAVVNTGFYAQERRTGERNERYMAEAVPLAAHTVQRCLETAGVAPDEVDDLLVVSCTGIDTPGLDLRLAGRLGMRPDLRRASLLGMGCYGALPGLLRAQQAVAAQPPAPGKNGRTSLLVAVELCSLHFQPDDPSIENVVATALFADGAAAVLLGSGRESPAGTPLPAVVDGATFCDYTTFEHMAFHLTDHGFKMRLSAYVPDLLAAKVESFLDGMLARHGLSRAGVRFWGVHPGSSKILDHVQARMGLSDEQLIPSRAVLRDYGNMSSPTVLFVLDHIQRECGPRPGDTGLLLAFGPGLTMESILLKW